MSVVARLVTGDRVDSVWTWCPGCDSLHPFRIRTVDGDLPTWEWDGNLERPTFSPSLLCRLSIHLCEGEHDPVVCEDHDTCSRFNSHQIGHVVDGVLLWRFPNGIPDNAGPDVFGHGQPHTKDPAYGPCHSFLKAGRWEFLSDSAHRLAGQTVDMVPLPDGWAD